MKLLFLALIWSPLVAQTGRQSAIAQEIVDKAQAMTNPDGTLGASGIAGVVRPDPLTGASVIDGLIATWLLDRRGSNEEVLTWMEQRTELQMSANPVVASSSSAAIKAVAPRVLSIAVDMGMLSRTTNGQYVTFRGTPAGIAQAMFGWSVLHRPWDRLTAAATFDTNRGASPGTLTASIRQLASWSAGFEVYNARKPRSAEWLSLLQGSANYLHAREALIAAFAQWEELRDWQTDFAARIDREVDRPLTRGQLQAADARRTAVQIAVDELDLLARLKVAPGVAQALESYVTELRGQLNSRNSLRQVPRKGPIVALDWTVIRPVDQHAQWAATAIAQTTLGSRGHADLTANWTMHSSGAAIAALELTVPGQSGFASLSARVGRSNWNRGHFEFTAQATWTILLSTGVRLPISVGLNRNVLMNAPTPQATIGVQLATDALRQGMH